MKAKFKSHPFNQEAVRATMDGRKTQFRIPMSDKDVFDGLDALRDGATLSDIIQKRSPFHPGDIVGIKEAWWDFGKWEPAYIPGELDDWENATWRTMLSSEGTYKPMYVADVPEAPQVKGLEYSMGLKWRKRPSIHLPKEFIRLFIEITEVRAERLQEISHADSKAEGVFAAGHRCPGFNPDLHTEKESDDCPNENSGASDCFRCSYIRDIKKSKKGRDYWNSNLWHWVYSYRVVEKPFKPCGEGDNICSCKSEKECGYTRAVVEKGGGG